MELYELLDIAASGYDRIDVLWNFFIWIHMAVIGAMIIVTRYVNLAERAIAISTYLAFIYMNYIGLADAYAYQVAVLQEIANYELASGGAGELVIDHMRQSDLEGRVAYFDYIHMAAAILVTLALSCINWVGDLKEE